MRNAKNETVKLRVSTKEKRAIAAAANREGLLPSAWLRQKALLAAGYITGIEVKS